MIGTAGLRLLLLGTVATSAAFLQQLHASIPQSSTALCARKKVQDAASDTAPDQRQEALSGVLSQIEKLHGRGSIQKLGETDTLVECTSTGSLTLDLGLGGGYPKGRIIEIYGPEASGKTTLALHAIAEAQAQGGYAAFIDAEHALDATYAKAMGVDTDNLLISQPDCGEMALDIVDHLIRSQAVSMVVVDSVAALVPRAELEGDMADAQIGLQARLMSKALRKITGSLASSKCTVIFLNQLRSKIGVLYGSPEVTSGGNALKYFSTLRLDVRRKEILKDEGGIRCKVKVVKNKVAPPFRMIELDVLFGKGIDKEGGLIDAAENVGIIERRGAWFNYQGNNIAQGRAKLREHLSENANFRRAIETELRRKLQPSAFLDVAGILEDEENAEAGIRGALPEKSRTEEMEVELRDLEIAADPLPA